jgi:hypothetical protein
LLTEASFSRCPISSKLNSDLRATIQKNMVDSLLDDELGIILMHA